MVHINKSSRNISLGMGGGVISSLLYAQLIINSMVVFTGTLVYKLFMSREATRPVADMGLIFSRSLGHIFLSISL